MHEWLAPEFVQADLSINIARAEMFVLRAPCETPVRTSFGTMFDRPAVFVRLEASDGATGLGEVWCNFPSCGAEHRGRLLETAIFPALLDGTFDSPADCFAALTNRFERLAIQAGEKGPVAQCLAGIDGALWDLVAKRADAPLYRLLGGTNPIIATYASGINPAGASDTVARCRANGHVAFKLKIGFGDETDLANLAGIADGLAEGDELMTDANQAWTVEQTAEMLPKLAEFPLRWLEEPIMATSSANDWMALAQASSIPLAAGENMMGRADFEHAAASGIFGVLQPDLCKWGGVSGTFPVARIILHSGRRYCPHFLGGGIGLAASAHLLAAVGGDGLLEIDSNANSLREDLFSPTVMAGKIDIGRLPGIGISDETFAGFLGAQSPGTLTAKSEQNR
ncbi:MAG: mandelate racemase/muconate lactonizing enzyme family protein [Alphaproteobacteria bacterium]|nr:mandelate racemase/muconate lactonizing enzyme family protein [Alphaproteobacteria bacterium]